MQPPPHYQAPPQPVAPPAPAQVAQPAEEPRKKIKVSTVISNIIFYACLVLLIVAAVTFAQSDDPNKSLWGYRYYYIMSGSMEPKYPIGSVVFTKVTPPEDIEVGDVITVYIGSEGNDTYLTHRVVDISRDSNGSYSYRTKGDAARSNDPAPFGEHLLAGRVVMGVPMLGTIMNFIQSQLIFVVGIFILMILLSFMLKLLFSKEKDPEEGEPADSKKKLEELLREIEVVKAQAVEEAKT